MAALFLETIRLQAGKAHSLPWHQQRMFSTGQALGFLAPVLPPLEEMCPVSLFSQTVKCRVIYRDKIESITFERYKARSIRRLALVSLQDRHYCHKYLNRTSLESLRLSGDADEIILIDSLGQITDTTYSNLLFERKDGVWITPQRPLLFGTMRAQLLACSRGEKKTSLWF